MKIINLKFLPLLDNRYSKTEISVDRIIFVNLYIFVAAQ